MKQIIQTANDPEGTSARTYWGLTIYLNPQDRTRTRDKRKLKTEGSHFKSPSAVWAARASIGDPCR
jgi:hypothetical protein